MMSNPETKIANETPRAGVTGNPKSRLNGSACKRGGSERRRHAPSARGHYLPLEIVDDARFFMLKPNLTLQYLQYGGYDLIQVPENSIVSDLEDGSVPVRVDSGNHFRLLYPSNVLKLPRYPEGKVEGWFYRDAGEADMKLLGEPTIVG